MKIVQNMLTKNPCYKAGKKITVKGLMLHSVGCPQPSASVFINQWNNPTYNRACVHAFIDGNTGKVHQTLPWNHRGWHCGGSANDTHIGVEMCEPSQIKYTGGVSFTCTDKVKARAVVQRTYDTSVALFAHLCEKYSLDPMTDIISHKEGATKGVASKHSDPEHLWKQLGLEYTMDTFRKAVKVAMKKDVMYHVQVGAYKVKANADAQLKKVKDAGFDTCMVQVDGYYKIQVGAYSKKEYADEMLAKLKKAGFSACIKTKDVESVEPVKKEIKPGSTVRLKKGAKTFQGGNLASFVYERNHKVKEINVDRVVITYDGSVVAAVKKSDLILID